MEKIKAEYFAFWFKLNQTDWYLIWVLSEPESVLLDEQECIPVFRSEITLAAYAKARNIEIVNEQPIRHNLDAVEKWLQEPEGAIDCNDFLAAWNIFTDVAYGLKQKFLGDTPSRLRNRIYDKLFWGNNHFNGDPILGSATGEYYFPQWSAGEREKIVQVLTQGFELFRSRLKVINAKAIS